MSEPQEEPPLTATSPSSSPRAVSAASIAAAVASRQPAPPPLVPPEVREAEAKLKDARKQMIRIVNWQLNDDKHRRIDQILDTTQYLLKICGNVRDHPDEDKFRKIRITNTAFSRHVRDAPGGEEFMHAAGWTVQVHSFEKYFVLGAQPGSFAWAVLEAACAELAKLSALLDGKIKRGATDKKAAQEQLLHQVRAAIEEDKAHREVRFQPHVAGIPAQQLPPR